MTDDQAARKMAKFKAMIDCEAGHIAADALLCELLVAEGYPKAVRVFRSMAKWYS